MASYSYKDWTTNPLDGTLSSSEKQKKKPGILVSIRNLFSRNRNTNPRGKKPKKKHGFPFRRSESEPDITDNYNFFQKNFGGEGIRSSFYESPYDDVSPNSFFSEEGLRKKPELKQKKYGKSPVIPSREKILESPPDFDIPISVPPSRPALRNIFDISATRDSDKEDNKSSTPSSRPTSSNKSKTPIQSRPILKSSPELLPQHLNTYEEERHSGRPSPRRRLSPQSSDLSVKSSTSDRHDRYMMIHNQRSFERRGSLPNSLASSERSEERRSRRRGGLKQVGPPNQYMRYYGRIPGGPLPHMGIPQHMPPQRHYFMPPNPGYGYAPPMMYPPYGYGMSLQHPGYFNYFPTVPEEVGGEGGYMEETDYDGQHHRKKREHREHKENKEQRHRRRHRSRDYTRTDQKEEKELEEVVDTDLSNAPKGLDEFTLY